MIRRYYKSHIVSLLPNGVHIYIYIYSPTNSYKTHTNSLQQAISQCSRKRSARGDLSDGPNNPCRRKMDFIRSASWETRGNCGTINDCEKNREQQCAGIVS